MDSSRLGLLGRLVLVLLAVLAFSAIAATTAAQAEEAPRWRVNGSTLLKNETREITIKLFETKNPVVLTSSAGVSVECLLAKVAPGAFLAGSEPGEPGTSEAVSEFSDCKTTGNGTGCAVKEPIRTEKIRNEIVVNTKLSTYLIEFDPAAGSKTKFVELEFPGASCTTKKAPVTGLVVGTAFTDPIVNGGKEEEEFETTAENTSFLVRFPDNVKEVWLYKGGAHEKFKIEPLKFGAFEAELRGALLFLLTNGQKWGIRG
jgi:hypothetical protein